MTGKNDSENKRDGRQPRRHPGIVATEPQQGRDQATQAERRPQSKGELVCSGVSGQYTSDNYGGPMNGMRPGSVSGDTAACSSRA